MTQFKSLIVPPPKPNPEEKSERWWDVVSTEYCNRADCCRGEDVECRRCLFFHSGKFGIQAFKEWYNSEARVKYDAQSKT